MFSLLSLDPASDLLLGDPNTNQLPIDSGHHHCNKQVSNVTINEQEEPTEAQRVHWCLKGPLKSRKSPLQLNEPNEGQKAHWSPRRAYQSSASLLKSKGLIKAQEEPTKAQKAYWSPRRAHWSSKSLLKSNNYKEGLLKHDNYKESPLKLDKESLLKPSMDELSRSP